MLDYVKRISPYVWLILILGVGVAVRLVLSPHPGHGNDLGINRGWAQSAVEFGLAASYRQQLDHNMLPNYPPLSVLLFGGVGHLHRSLVSLIQQPDELYHLLLKLPAMMTDIATCFVLYVALCRWRSQKVGLLGALLYAIQPAVIYESAVWGQTDSIYTFFLLAALTTMLSQRYVLAGVCTTLACLTKAQAAIFVPLILILLPMRSLPVIDFLLAGVSATIAVIMPFVLGGSIQQVVGTYTNTLEWYTNLSLNAYNLWWALFGPDQAWSRQSTALLLPFLSYRTLGILLFAAVYIAALTYLRFPHPRRRGDLFQRVFTAGSLIALAFFLLNTEMHERYFFPFLALGIPFALASRKAMMMYLVFSCTLFFNLLGALSFGDVDRAIFGAIPMFSVVLATLNVTIFTIALAPLLSATGRCILALMKLSADFIHRLLVQLQKTLRLS